MMWSSQFQKHDFRGDTPSASPSQTQPPTRATSTPTEYRAREKSAASFLRVQPVEVYRRILLWLRISSFVFFTSNRTKPSTQCPRISGDSAS